MQSEMEQPSLPEEVTLANARILIGDSRAVLALLAPESVQCCVTSPPYWGLRDYEHAGQLGAEESPKQYVANLVDVFREVRRVLRPDGTFWLNVGDGYARNGGVGVCGPNAKVGNTKKLIQKRNCRVPDCWGLKDRDLIGLPWRVAFALQEDGWILRSKITWVKKAPMPESVKNRPSGATEEIFLFAKQPGYYYDHHAVREPSGANLRNYWMLGPGTGGGSHPAVFPRELARRCILLGSRPGDVVLDPFSGSGTTGIVAVELRRQAILVELNEAYARESEARTTSRTGNGLTVVLRRRKNDSMMTKVISVDLDAYKRLCTARLQPEESFSQVIKRARWDLPPSTGAALLAALQRAPLVDDATIQRLEAAQREDVPPTDAWTE
jgi:site-specific DNA-methyltransferase (cytosine-N4-specific)